MNSRSLILALTIALAPGVASSASVYKWTDENGVTHFGDRQPTGQRTESVNIKTPPRSGSPGEQASPQERAQALDERNRSEEEIERLREVEEIRKRQRQANCDTARSSLETLNLNGRIYKEEDGERHYLSPEEIVEQRRANEKAIEEYCGPEDS